MGGEGEREDRRILNKGEKERNAVASLSVSQSSEKNKLAPLHSVLLTFVRSFAFSFYTYNVCTDHLRQKNTFGHRYTSLFQDTLSTNPM